MHQAATYHYSPRQASSTERYASQYASNAPGERSKGPIDGSVHTQSATGGVGAPRRALALVESALDEGSPATALWTRRACTGGSRLDRLGDPSADFRREGSNAALCKPRHSVWAAGPGREDGAAAWAGAHVAAPRPTTQENCPEKMNVPWCG
jgi:hypothetical protein